MNRYQLKFQKRHAFGNKVKYKGNNFKAEYVKFIIRKAGSKRYQFTLYSNNRVIYFTNVV